jgi:hypothetical protein
MDAVLLVLFPAGILSLFTFAVWAIQTSKV